MSDLPARIAASAQESALALIPGDPALVEASARRLASAFALAVRTAKNPSDWQGVSVESIREAVRASHETGLYPGGPAPMVYLVPRNGQVSWSLTHRGVCELARRAGMTVRTWPVSRADEIEVEAGLVVRHVQSPDAWPTGLADLRGVIVEVDGIRHWAPAAMIGQRAKAKGAGPVWSSWPIEMAQKTAILWLMRRGVLPAVAGLEHEAPEAVEVVAEGPRRGLAELPPDQEAVEAAEVFVATHAATPEQVGLPAGWTRAAAAAALSRAARKPIVWADLPDDGEFGRRAAAGYLASLPRREPGEEG